VFPLPVDLMNLLRTAATTGAAKTAP